MRVLPDARRGPQREMVRFSKPIRWSGLNSRRYSRKLCNVAFATNLHTPPPKDHQQDQQRPQRTWAMQIQVLRWCWAAQGAICIWNYYHHVWRNHQGWSEEGNSGDPEGWRCEGNKPEPGLVTAKEAYQKIPQMCLKFYEDLLVWDKKEVKKVEKEASKEKSFEKIPEKAQ